MLADDLHQPGGLRRVDRVAGIGRGVRVRAWELLALGAYGWRAGPASRLGVYLFGRSRAEGALDDDQAHRGPASSGSGGHLRGARLSQSAIFESSASEAVGDFCGRSVAILLHAIFAESLYIENGLTGH